MLQGSENLGSLEVQNAALFVILLSQLGSGIFGSVHVHVAQGGREAGSSLKVRFVEHAESPQDFGTILFNFMLLGVHPVVTTL